MVISRAFNKEIQSSLNSKYLSSEDFEVSTKKEQKGGLSVTITYLYNPQYEFYFKSGDQINIVRRPGEMAENESLVVTGKDGILTAIYKWLKNIEAETKAAPILREIMEHKVEVDLQISELENSIKDIGQDDFTKDEISSLIEKLNKFQEEFESRLEEEIQDKQKLRNEINNIGNEIEFLKSQIQLLTKQNWVKSLLVKSINWRKRNPQAMNTLVNLTREMLPEGVREHIPDAVVDLIAPTSEDH
ncbi:hypothetical protein NSQ91_14065 [Paenibacillus sp. FSL R7-0048]|uniref:hypothetical protein n=1 Tax=Paenibacillus TaxID=44249 RepID=UPI00096C5588|nr:hypothetical protein [Paenibacillus odorifer]OMD87814.1 hypothetical protein BSK53_02155 [Paenibacillus odorifer]